LNLKFLKFEKKESDFEGFQLPEVSVKKNVENYIWDFQLCSQKFRRIIKLFVLYFWFINQIWLNLPRDDHHFFYIFLMDDSQFFYKQKKFLKEKTTGKN